MLDDLKRGVIVRYEAVDRLAGLSAQIGAERWSVHADVERAHLLCTTADGRVRVQPAPMPRWRTAGPAVLLGTLALVALVSWIASLRDPGRVEPEPKGAPAASVAP